MSAEFNKQKFILINTNKGILTNSMKIQPYTKINKHKLSYWVLF